MLPQPEDKMYHHLLVFRARVRLYLKPVRVGLDRHDRPIPVRSLRELRISHPITRRRSFTRGSPISFRSRNSSLALLPYPGLLTRPPSCFHNGLVARALGVSRIIIRYLARFDKLTSGWPLVDANVYPDISPGMPLFRPSQLD